MFELAESSPACATSRDALLNARSWSRRELRRALRRAMRDGLVHERPGAGIALTRAGQVEAQRVVRNHRLWELFLITHADIAASHVDRDADAIEHVLKPEMARELEQLLLKEQPGVLVPASPHAITPSGSLAKELRA